MEKTIVSGVELSVSVVSHGQIELISYLLQDIGRHCGGISLEVLLTLNIEEELPFKLEDWPFSILVIRNQEPAGFGANHNHAFEKAHGEYFCVINPDIRFNADPFHALIECLKDKKVAVVAPLVLGRSGEREDSARKFPSPLGIACKVVGRCKGSDYDVEEHVIFPDWVGGMFMVFRKDAFRQLGGFDDRYFLYYEDVDLCARVRLLNQEVALCPASRVVHDARRSSHRSVKYLRLHLASMFRFFFSLVYLRILIGRSR